MNKSDKYYLRSGKLELSMLDDEEVNEHKVQIPPNNGELDQVEFEHTKRISEKKKELTTQPQLKVSQDVYNTLHIMGQFLTKQDDGVGTVETKKGVISAKEQRLQKIARTIKVQDEKIPSKGFKAQQQEQERISSNNVLQKPNEEVSQNPRELQDLNTQEVLKKDTTVNDQSNEVEQVSAIEANSAKVNEVIQKEAIAETLLKNEIKEPLSDVIPLEMYRPFIRENSLHKAAHEIILEQQSIDAVLDACFCGKYAKASSYPYLKELKSHVEKVISEIKNYE